ncbi:MAG TPA: hypothetical protein DIT67_03275 [Octadecabacter sp.]|nr:hypothetical protein [Octadecabacter sp.]
MYIFGLYIFAAIAMISGIAIDVSHLNAERTRLQYTTDLAAHAALYNRDSKTSLESITAALAVVEKVMPANEYGTILTASDFHFGTYDHVTDSFVTDSTLTTAVLVNARREAAGGNPVSNFLLQFAGFSAFDVSAQAVFTTFRPACLREGFVSEGVVDIQSNNGFSSGFCIHSNTHVSLNQNNYFEEGTIVSMPDLDDLDLPNSGFENNEGLQVALRQGRQHIRVLSMLDEIAEGLFDFNSEHMPAYITDPIVNYHFDRTYDPADFVPGTINYLDCNHATLDGGIYTDLVIYSECDVKFGNGVILENVVIFSEDTSRKAFTASAGLQVGRDDDCAADGGGQLITYGGMNFPSSLQLYGGQLIALGDIEFAANADGIEGASMISAGEINGTSNMDMAFCGTGMENNFEAEYFRLAH